MTVKRSTSASTRILLAAACAAFVLAGMPVQGNATSREPAPPSLKQLPPTFIKNEGQVDPRAQYYAKGPSSTLWLTSDGIVFDLSRTLPEAGSAGKQSGKSGGSKEARAESTPARGPEKAETTERVVFRLDFENRSESMKIEGIDPQEAKVSYFVGSDPSQWKTGIPTFGSVAYREVWPGVDLVFRGEEGKLKYEFHVAKGADPARILLAYQGVGELKLSDAGDLIVQTAFGEVPDEKPHVYQLVEGKQVPVGAKFRIEEGSKYGFEIAPYDKSRELVLDPALSYSTYLGAGGDDVALAVAVDGAGNAYVTGSTSSSSFPTQGPLQGTIGGGKTDAFVSKLSPSGAALLYSTYLGGSGDEAGVAIAVDGAGMAYVAGFTGSSNFPTLTPYQAANAGGQYDCFVTKLAFSGAALSYSTYLGGGGKDAAAAIAVNSSGNAFVTGITTSANFPTQSPYQASLKGLSDAFVTKLAPSGTTVSYSTYLGGTGLDYASGIAVDSTENAYVAGSTTSTNFPAKNAVQASFAGGTVDAFVTKLAPSGTTLSYSTYLGGGGKDFGSAIAVDTSGASIVSGRTASSNFPTQSPYQPANAGGESDAFAAKLSASGSSFVYSTYLGGSGTDAAYGVAVSLSGNATLTGLTGSTNFPTRNAYQGTPAGGIEDAFVTKLSPAGSSLDYSTYFGGSGADRGYGVAVDDLGNATVAGSTESADLPTAGAFQGAHGGGQYDAFVAKLSPCFSLTRSHMGSGGDPTALPGNSTGCSAGQYRAGEGIQLTASPAAGWGVASWSGTDNDASTATENALTMPQNDHAVGVSYVQIGGLWNGSFDLGGGWRYLDWLGFFNINSDPWIYHQELEWMYVSGTTTADLWIYYPKMAAWLWTSDTTFPFLYRATGLSPAWIYYLEWTAHPSWFHNQTTDAWESYP